MILETIKATLTRHSKTKMLITFLVLAALVVFPLLTENLYALHLMILLFMSTTMGGSWNIVGGYTGQYSVGHSAYFGAGAYGTLILLQNYQIPPWYAGWVGAFAGVVVALLVGSVCFRLRGPYFVLASIAVAEIIRISAINLTGLTNGAQGILAGDIPPLKIAGVLLSDFIGKVPFYYFGLSLTVIVLAMNYVVHHSKLGYYFQAIREDQDAADSLGISLTFYKNVALVLSAIFTALAGSFYAVYIGFIDPGTVLSLDMSVQIVLVCIIGGIGTIMGPAVGALVLVPLSEALRSNLITQGLFKIGLVTPESKVGIFLNDNLSHAHVLIYGILVVVVILYMPDGVLGFLRSTFSRRKVS